MKSNQERLKMFHHYEQLEDALDKSKDLFVYWEAATERAVEVTMGLHLDVVCPAGDTEKKTHVRTLKMRVNLQSVMAGKQKELVDKLLEEALTRLETGQALGDQVRAALDSLDTFEVIIKELNKELWVADEYLQAELKKAS